MECNISVGNTPMLKIKNANIADIYVKLEYLNPTGSHKDRIAYYILKKEMERGRLKRGDEVVEASTGNTGISVAYFARCLGLLPYIVVPYNTTPSKVRLLRMLGAVVTYGSEDPNDPDFYVYKARKMAEEHGMYFVNQYENPLNAEAHYMTTAREIWEQTGGDVDAFVMGVGTGGTLVGVGKFLTERKRDVLIVAVTPSGSKLSELSAREDDPERPARIEGLVSSFIPKLLDTDLIDVVIQVSESDIASVYGKVVTDYGILGGPSTVANIFVSLKIADILGKGKKVVTIAPDSIFRYI